MLEEDLVKCQTLANIEQHITKLTFLLRPLNTTAKAP